LSFWRQLITGNGLLKVKGMGDGRREKGGQEKERSAPGDRGQSVSRAVRAAKTSWPQNASLPLAPRHDH
jgi:hypothetical protein